MQRLISTHVEASKIGRQIAEEVLDSQRHGGDSSSDGSPSPDAERSLPPQITQSTAEVLAHQFMKSQMVFTPSIFLSICCIIKFLILDLKNLFFVYHLLHIE
jgi:hypothetical protein